MIAIEMNIIALVERIEHTREAFQRAQEAKQVARDALLVAEEISNKALLDYYSAQNALIVAAGGTDRSFILDLPRQ